MSVEFEAVIGLEVHCQLATESKIFCACRARPLAESTGQDVNQNICPICTGHPGTLPVLNEKVVQYAIQAGLATHCKIRERSVFARKNYFYPDLPKGYQISQHEFPLCEEGWLAIDTQQGFKKISISRIHIEEDAGKSVHMADFSLVNLNRAGVPLIEIVSGPDMRSSLEAGAYLRALHAIVTYLGICDGNMQDGNFRCDANVSVRPVGSTLFGTRTEIKNVNSFRFVEKAIEYEIERQIALIQSGGQVVLETRTYDSIKHQTLSLRSKEEAADYRYFSEPDLIPLWVSEDCIERERSHLPEMPEQKRKRFIENWGLSSYDAGVLTSSKSLVLFFEKVMAQWIQEGEDPVLFAKSVSNTLSGEVSRLLNEQGLEITETRLQPAHLVDLVRAIHHQVISSTAAKQVIQLIWDTGESVQKIIATQNLQQISDSSVLEKEIEAILVESPKQVEAYRKGKIQLMGFFVGQVMKRTQGKANPTVLADLLKNMLDTRS